MVGGGKINSMKTGIFGLGCPTPRAPDGWESPRFQAGFWLEADSTKVA